MFMKSLHLMGSPVLCIMLVAHKTRERLEDFSIDIRKFLDSLCKIGFLYLI